MELDLQQIIEDLDRHAPDDPLDRVVAATFRQQELADLGDQVLDHFVQAARQAGCSWSQIGEALGVSKQAAQQRHGSEGGDDSALDGLVGWFKRQARGLRRFQRFTPRARNCVMAAQTAARDLGHQEISTEHVLVGLFAEPEGIAAKLLAGWSITRDDVVRQIEERAGRGPGTPEGHIPFTGGAKQALERTLKEAIGLGHNYIGTEHILLSLTQDEGLAGEILRDRDVTRDRARPAVIQALQGLAG
jgi:hypothetical protein